MDDFAATAAHWLCPDLRPHWRLARSRRGDSWVLQSRENSIRLRFDHAEGYALTRFSGSWTVQAVQDQCMAEFGDSLPSDFIIRLIYKLVDLGVLAPDDDKISSEVPPREAISEVPRPPWERDLGRGAPAPSGQTLGLKPGCRWTHQRDGHWILGDAEGLHHVQVSPADKAILDCLGQMPLPAIPRQTGCAPQRVKMLVNLLAQAQLLTGVEPPSPPRRKFTPLQLLYFKKALLNPDRWLSRHRHKFHWLGRPGAGLVLGLGLACTAVFALAHRPALLLFGQRLLQTYGWGLLLPFGLLAMAVVSLHELAHAFTLKHFGGAVSEMGLLFMCLIPAAYTNSSDSYQVSNRRRCWVIGAGVLCQLVIAAIAFWFWFATASSAGLHTVSYLLLVAALFTVALNLNPMARFDGYYLLSAATGIRNLRPRAFLFYKALLQRQPSPERGRDRWILAAYGPLSVAYLLLVFGQLFLWLASAILTHIPYLALVLFILWLIYYLSPEPHDRLPQSP
jgi:putative peptide zinc metalloprotease protein